MCRGAAFDRLCDVHARQRPIVADDFEPCLRVTPDDAGEGVDERRDMAPVEERPYVQKKWFPPHGGTRGGAKSGRARVDHVDLRLLDAKVPDDFTLREV